MHRYLPLINILYELWKAFYKWRRQTFDSSTRPPFKERFSLLEAIVELLWMEGIERALLMSAYDRSSGYINPCHTGRLPLQRYEGVSEDFN